MFEKEILTLSIENDSVRAVLTKGRQVVKWGTRPLQNGWVRDGLVSEIQEVGAAIDRLLTDQQLPRRQVAVAITGLRAIFRILTFPKMSSSLLASTVMREAKREIPVPLEEVYLSWQILADRGALQEVFLVSVPRELVDASMQALRLANIRPRLMDLKPLALARAINKSHAVAANFEADCLETVIVANDTPVVMRAVTLIGESQDAAEHTRRMVDELSRTVRFYNDSHKDAALPADTPIYLTGALAQNADLRDTVEGCLSYPVGVLEPPFRYPPAFPVALYMINLGLALKQM